MPGSERSEPLEGALDELYGVDASEFVATRTRLAVELRDAGDAAAAKTLRAARRPTTTAWALNQLTRREPELVAELLDRSRDVEAAQTGELPGGRDAIRDATKGQRRALGAATDAALAVLGPRGTEAFRGQIMATLQAASADPEVGEQLRQGRFVRELSGPTGFPDIPGLALVPDLVPEPEAERPKRRPPTTDRPKVDRAAAEQAAQAERARAAEAAYQQRLDDAERVARRGREEADAADAAAESARQRVEQLKRELEDARQAARAAADRAANAKRESARLARASAKLRERLPTSDGGS